MFALAEIVILPEEDRENLYKSVLSLTANWPLYVLPKTISFAVAIELLFPPCGSLNDSLTDVKVILKL